MKRIHMHWTAGRNTVSSVDLEHYHYIIDQHGQPVAGNNPVSANASPIKGQYAAHTLNANSDAIGVAVAGMFNAKESPFDPGPSAMMQMQIDGLVKLVARLCKEYGIPVTRETVLSHAEVQPTLGIKQRGKWDIMWLPGMAKPGDPVAVGDKLRASIRAAMQPDAPVPPPPFTYDAGSYVAAFFKAIAAIFQRKG